MREEFVEDILAEGENNDQNLNSDDQNINNDDQNINNDQTLDADKDQNLNNDEHANDPESEETIESLATKLGWNPDHKGDDFIDAPTYILKSREIQDTMKEHNRDLKNQLSNVQGSIDALKEHNEKVYQANVRKMQKELTELKQQKREAIETADVKKVDEIDEKIEALQKDINEPAPKEKTSSDNPIFDDWVKDNQWYLINDEMATYAETVAQEYKGAPLDRIYKMVRKKVEEVFPEKFEKKKTDDILKPNKNKPIGPSSPVESARKAGKDKSTFTKADLTDEQRMIMNQFVKSGVMSEEQYINDVAKMQEA